MTGIDGEEPINYRQIIGAWSAGTREAVAILDSLAIPVDDGRQKVRAALKVAGHKVRNDVLSAAIRYRKSQGGIL
jgi:hypothetical protein